MVSDKHKLLFYHIPRTGGSSIEILVTGHDYAYLDHKYKHPSMEDFKKKYYDKWDDYYKFTVVRNPFEWVRSLYSKNRSKNNDFPHFCNNLSFDTRDTGNGFIYENIKGVSFSEIITDEFDKIYRYEDLVNEDYNQINLLCNSKKKVYRAMSYENHHTHPKPIHTIESFESIKDKFKNDFIRFYPELVNITYEDVKNQNYNI